MECSEIKNGKYTVTIKFKGDLRSKIKEVLHKEPEFKKICCIDGNIFHIYPLISCKTFPSIKTVITIISYEAYR